MGLTRSIVSRLRQYVGDRRHAHRLKVRLPFTLSIASPAKGLDGEKRIHSLAGHTLDLSPSGMALIVPAIRIGDHHLVGENRTLNVKLELPGGPLELQVSPVRYEALEDHPSEIGYLIGVRIIDMPTEDREVFTAYFSKLAGNKVAEERSTR